MSRPQPNMQPNNQNNNGPARTQSLIITAITLFALSGLIIGFAAGAITRPQQAAQPTPGSRSNQTTVQQAQPTAAATKVTPQQLGCPVIDQADGEGVADGSSTYTLHAHAIDSSAGASGPNCLNGKPIQTAGITCRLWLSKIPDNKIINLTNTWKNVNAPQPGEVENGLIFSSTTPQCDDKGQASWKFSISPQVKHGSYYLVILTAWGQYGNWSWTNFKVDKG
jgi:hypothetical protein